MVYIMYVYGDAVSAVTCVFARRRETTAAAVWFIRFARRVAAAVSLTSILNLTTHTRRYEGPKPNPGSVGYENGNVVGERNTIS